MNSPLAERLGCALDEGPFGPVIRTDAANLMTEAGVYATGDIARAPHGVSWAVADGVTAGVPVHQSIVLALGCLIMPNECRVRFRVSTKRSRMAVLGRTQTVPNVGLRRPG
ncbi:hypothetical protein [Methylobacterium sp. Leaf117]|uniref:hypothetical protein n=1 Tax=Methylobacterium sp. Leaf117 TaxID=1736260 RepID=UPI0006FE43B3|nr:hypothetical protein [Methylobacterium sp. Leaf117]KQP95465.1 hypothetical protein ASF57_20610 [Methylobacterium sp. Leaf117]